MKSEKIVIDVDWDGWFIPFAEEVLTPRRGSRNIKVSRFWWEKYKKAREDYERMVKRLKNIAPFE